MVADETITEFTTPPLLLSSATYSSCTNQALRPTTMAAIFTFALILSVVPTFKPAHIRNSSLLLYSLIHV